LGPVSDSVGDGVGDLAFGHVIDPDVAGRGTKQCVTRLVVVELKVGEKLANPVTLAQIKADPAFKGFDLVRISRLSVMPVPEPMWNRILELGGNNPSAVQKPKKEARRR